jgi:hypothetical protein
VEVEVGGGGGDERALELWGCVARSSDSALLKSGDEAGVDVGAGFLPRACKVDPARRRSSSSACNGCNGCTSCSSTTRTHDLRVAWTGSSERNKTYMADNHGILEPPHTPAAAAAEVDRRQIQCTSQLPRCPCCRHYSASWRSRLRGWIWPVELFASVPRVAAVLLLSSSSSAKE